jgi:uncharacterized membrane protein (DUF2068 family)
MGASEKSNAGKGNRAPTLYVIIAIKLIKGVLMLLLGLGVYRLSDNNLPAEFHQTLEFFHLDPEKKFFTLLADKISEITPANIIWLARGTVLYSLFSLVEAVGLMFRVSWAGWLTISESAFFIPIEIYELMRTERRTERVSVVVILALNIVIVWYLYQNRRRLFGHHRGAA